MAGANSKWVGPKRGGGDYRRLRDDVKIGGVSERAWAEERREQPGWRNGASVYPVKT
jgi:hypothetical protein